MSHGYGVISVNKRMRRVHRLLWERINGPVPPESPDLDHFRYPQDGCIGPACVNPEHVRPASHRENIYRGGAPHAWNLAKVECDHGHAFTKANTYLSREGWRYCRTCRRIREARRKAARRAAAPRDHLEITVQ